MKTDMKSRLNAFIEKNKHAFLLLYFCIYFPWFHHLERTVTTHFHVIHTALDDRIPFCEYFIVPYLLWFGYVAWAVGYFYFKNKDEYFKLCAMLFTGMTVFLVISTIYPNGHYLRPAYFEHNNIFIQMVKWLYATDTPTNLFPSIHVYNSLGVHISVMNSGRLKNRRWVRRISFVIMVAICLSTVFLKQHSVADVTGALALAYVMYQFVYGNVYVFSRRTARQKVTG